MLPLFPNLMQEKKRFEFERCCATNGQENLLWFKIGLFFCCHCCFGTGFLTQQNRVWEQQPKCLRASFSLRVTIRTEKKCRTKFSSSCNY